MSRESTRNRATLTKTLEGVVGQTPRTVTHQIGLRQRHKRYPEGCPSPYFRSTRSRLEPFEAIQPRCAF
jgi:hypothetical protein